MENQGRRDDRRAGPRVPVDRAVIRWSPIVPKTHFQRAAQTSEAAITEVSVSGAAIRARADRRVQVGTEVAIEVGDARGVVRVRRIEPMVPPSIAHYEV